MQWDEDLELQKWLIRHPIVEKVPRDVHLRNVGSSVATYFIWRSFYEHGIPVAESHQRWVQEIQGPLRAIFKQVREDKHEFEAVLFVTRVALYLRTGKLKNWEKAQCLFSEANNNFILTLLKTNTCQCSCFAYYIYAAAEEFGYSSQLALCRQPSHLTLDIISRSETIETPIHHERISALLGINGLKYHYRKRNYSLTPLHIANLEASLGDDPNVLSVRIRSPNDKLLEAVATLSHTVDIRARELKPCDFPHVGSWGVLYFLLKDLTDLGPYHNVNNDVILPLLLTLGQLFSATHFIHLFLLRSVLRDHNKEMTQRETDVNAEIFQTALLHTRYMDSQMELAAMLLDLTHRLTID